MKKKIAILGSTGSIGKSTLEIIKNDKKNLALRKFKLGEITSIINMETKEKINDPKTPDKVFFGLILVNFFHLKIFPNI